MIVQGPTSTSRRLDLDGPSRGEQVGEVQRILGIAGRREQVAGRLAADPFRDDIADVRTALGRRPNPERHRLVVQARRPADGLVGA